MKTTPTRFDPLFLAGRVSFARLCAALLLFGGIVPGVLTSRVIAQGVVPERFAFQGYMEDGNGQPLGLSTPVNYLVVFRIFPAATGGLVASWAEKQAVTFDKGNYSVILGQGAQNFPELHGDLSAVVNTATSSELFVQTTVTINGNDLTILPRLRLLPAAYAFLAKKALNADLATRADSAARADVATWAATATNAFLATYAVNAGQAASATIATTAVQAQTVASVNGSVIAAGTIPQTALAPAVVTSLTGPIADSRLSANVALRNAANTFTGPQTIQGNATVNGTATVNGNATVTGDLKLGASAQYSAASGLAAFRIITGTLPGLAVPSPQNNASGLGWTAERVGDFWKVTFVPAFQSTPFVLAQWTVNSANTAQDGSASPPMIAQSGGVSFQVFGRTTGSGLAIDTTFLAIGPR